MEPENNLDVFCEENMITKIEIKEEPLWMDGKPVEVKADIQDPLVSGADFRKNKMEDTSKKRKRTENYTSEETLKLLECVRKYQHIVENKKIDSATCKQKDQAWEKICEDYNSSNTSKKTAKMLRGKFESLKKKVRKYIAAREQNRVQTGGGSPTEIKSKVILDMVQEIIQISVEGLSSVSDTDNISGSITIETETSTDENCVAAKDIGELVSLELDVPVISLESLQECSYSNDLSAQDQQSTAVDVERSCTAQASIHCNEGNQSRQIGSASGGSKLSTWEELQQELLRKEFAQREKRENELHMYNIQIKKTELQIKKAELIKHRLDIQIKKQALKSLDVS